jgi:probable rRNA maturation factor
MNVIVELCDDSAANWVPDETTVASWVQAGLDMLAISSQLGISLRYVDAGESEQLNKRFRDKQAPTNVLSFPVDLPPSVCEQMSLKPLGDVVICPHIVEQEAQEQGKELQAHWAHMVLHGVLHLLGYDHADQASAEQMEALEIRALERLGFPNPYLIG